MLTCVPYMESQMVQSSEAQHFRQIFFKRFQSSSPKSNHVQRIFFQVHGIFKSSPTTRSSHIQQFPILRPESIGSSSRNELSFLSTKSFSQFSRIIPHRPHIPVIFQNSGFLGQASIAITLNVANSFINNQRHFDNNQLETLSTKCLPTIQ